MIPMKKNKGITMISLVLTVIMLIILSSVTIQVGVQSYNEVKIQNFISKLKVIQTKVDNIAEEKEEITDDRFRKLAQITEEEKQNFEEIIQNLSNDDTFSWSDEDAVIENYYYFTPKDLEEQLHLKDQDMTVIINFKTRNVITKKGLKLDGKTYYRQYDLNEYGGEQLVK